MTSTVNLPLSAARQAGNLIFVSGQLALHDGQINGADVAQQTQFVIDAIAAHLVPFGLDLGDVVKTSVWLTSAADFQAFNAAYATRFGAPYPARSTVISELALPDALVEIDAIALMRA